MRAKEGDRFQCKYTGNLWEIRSSYWFRKSIDDYDFIRHGYIDTDFAQCVVSDSFFTYLGNFNKSANFSNLYDILCES